MDEARLQTVALERLKDFEFVATYDGLPGAPMLLVDEEPPLGRAAGPNPAALLATAVGACLASSLVFCLKKSRIEPAEVRVRVNARIVRNEAGRFRIAGIDVDITPDVSDADAGRLLRCEGLFEDFCIVTESVRHGIPVNVNIAQRQGTQA